MENMCTKIYSHESPEQRFVNDFVRRIYLTVEITSTFRNWPENGRDTKDIIRKCNLIKMKMMVDKHHGSDGPKQPVSHQPLYVCVCVCHQEEEIISNAKPKWIFAFA